MLTSPYFLTIASRKQTQASSEFTTNSLLELATLIGSFCAHPIWFTISPHTHTHRPHAQCAGVPWQEPPGKRSGNLAGILAGILGNLAGNLAGICREFWREFCGNLAGILAGRGAILSSRPCSRQYWPNKNSRRIPAGIPEEFPQNSRQNSRQIPARFPARFPKIPAKFPPEFPPNSRRVSRQVAGFPRLVSKRSSSADVGRSRRRWNYMGASHGLIGIRVVGSSSTSSFPSPTHCKGIF